LEPGHAARLALISAAQIVPETAAWQTTGGRRRLATGSGGAMRAVDGDWSGFPNLKEGPFESDAGDPKNSDHRRLSPALRSATEATEVR
jgi:hypothetical protein